MTANVRTLPRSYTIRHDTKPIRQRNIADGREIEGVASYLLRPRPLERLRPRSVVVEVRVRPCDAWEVFDAFFVPLSVESVGKVERH